MRPDIDPAAVANGIVALMLSVLMSVTQLGSEAAVAYSQDVAAVFEAALDRSRRRRPDRRPGPAPPGPLACRGRVDAGRPDS